MTQDEEDQLPHMDPEDVEREYRRDTRAIAVRQEPAGALAPAAPLQAATAAEKRVQEVSEALLPAFRAASTLRLTEEEAKRLAEPFPDSDISERTDERGVTLLYIEHMAVRQRLIEIFGPGQWSMIRRREWVEDFFTKKNKPAKEIYAEWVMLIRGCRVGETVASHSYYPDNSGMSYADALESTEGEAVRRIAAKMLGCGSQVWISSFREGWQQRQREARRQQQPVKPPAPKPTPPAPVMVPKAKTADVGTPAGWADELPAEKRAPFRKRWMELLKPNELGATEFYQAESALLPNETLNDLPDRFIPCTKENANKVLDAIAKWMAGGEPETAKDEPPEVADLKQRVVPFGKEAGKLFADLPKAKLWWWAMKSTIGQPWVGKDGKERPAKPEDVELRRLLDVATDYYGFSDNEAQ